MRTSQVYQALCSEYGVIPFKLLDFTGIPGKERKKNEAKQDEDDNSGGDFQDLD